MHSNFTKWLFLAVLAAHFSQETTVCAAHLPNPLSFVYDDGNGNTQPYRLFVPPNHDEPDAMFPLVLFLHGSAERGTDNSFSLNSQQALIDATQGERFESFLLVPQMEFTWSHSGDTSFPESLDLTEQIIDQLESQYSINGSRRYVTGISAGGFGTWDFITARPAMFNAAVPLAGTGNASLAPLAKNVRVWAFHGRNDTIVPTHGARAMIEALRQAGGSPLYSETIDGHSDMGKFLDDPTDELYPWMFENVQPSLASLVYNAQNGNVKLLANEAPGGFIDGFGLKSNGEFLVPDTILVDGVPINTHDLFSTADENAFYYLTEIGPLGGVIDMGNLLPPGLDFQSVSDTLTWQAYRSPDTGDNLRYFQVFVVNIPEPSSVVLLSMGVFAVLFHSSFRFQGQN